MPTIIENGKVKKISIEEYNNNLKLQRQELGIGTDGKLKHSSVENLGKIWINEQEFTGMAYQGFLTVNTKTYVEEPTRSNDGSIPNINDYDTFVVPRCKVNFKYFNIDDYQRLCEAVQSNEFYVEYYDKQFDTFVKHKMYCEPEEMAKLYNVGTDVFGVLDYEISFIGTLNDLEEFTITYDGNGGTSSNEPLGSFDASKEYSRYDIVTLEGDRYYQAIWYDNKIVAKEHPLTDYKYWKEYDNVVEFNISDVYSKDRIVYSISTKDDKDIYSFYISVYNGDQSGQPLTDTYYWKKINVNKFDETKTYSSNRTYKDDTSFGNFVYSGTLPTNKIYEAIYYNESFYGKHPTDSTYWTQITYEGIKVKWGKSIVISDPESLFNPPEGKNNATEWNTKPNGSGFKYIIGQSINVYKNLTLYAQWR